MVFREKKTIIGLDTMENSTLNYGNLFPLLNCITYFQKNGCKRMYITHQNYVVINKVLQFFSNPFSPEVIKVVKDQQLGAQNSDGISLNNLKGLCIYVYIIILVICS